MHYAVPGRHDAVNGATMSPGQKYDMLIREALNKKVTIFYK